MPKPPDRTIDHYLRDNYGHLLTETERQAVVISDLRYKFADRPDVLEKHLALRRRSGRANPATDALLADGRAAFWARVAERLLREHADEIVVHRCAHCDALLRTPSAQQCVTCGHDWHGSPR